MCIFLQFGIFYCAILEPVRESNSRPHQMGCYPWRYLFPLTPTGPILTKQNAIRVVFPLKKAGIFKLKFLFWLVFD